LGFGTRGGGCHVTGDWETGDLVFTSAKIYRAAYCSHAHQRLDWKRHKPDCTAAQAEQGVGVEADKAVLEALSVHDLCARVASRGLDASGCVYKADLVRLLLSTAADGAPR
jgi:hypothetical protein